MRYLIALTLLTLACVAHADSARPVQTQTLLTARTTTGAGSGVAFGAGSKTFQASMTVSSGSGTATVEIDGSLNATSWDSLGTLTISNTASDSITVVAPAYTLYRANVTGLTGTGAAVTVKGGN